MFRSKEEQFDFYWKEIFDGLAYNPIEFNTYRFDQTMSLPGKVNKLYDMFKVLAMNNQEVMDYLKAFVETFDFKLETTVKDVLNVWLNEGLLADVVREAINDEVIEARTDYLGQTYLTLKERLDLEREEVVLARGGASTLEERLINDKNDVVVQLSNKTKQNFNLYEFSEYVVGDDWTIAIQTAIDEISLNGGVLYIPSGTYEVSSTLTLKSGVEINGVKEKTILKLIVNNKTLMSADGVNKFNIKGVKFVGGDANKTQTGLFVSSWEANIIDCTFTSFNVGVDLKGVLLNLESSYVVGNNTGVRITNVQENAFSTMISIKRCLIHYNNIGIDANRNKDTTRDFVGLYISKTAFEYNDYAYKLYHAINGKIEDCWFEQNNNKPEVLASAIAFENNRYEGGENQTPQFLEDPFGTFGAGGYSLIQGDKHSTRNLELQYYPNSKNTPAYKNLTVNPSTTRLEFDNNPLVTSLSGYSNIAYINISNGAISKTNIRDLITFTHNSVGVYTIKFKGTDYILSPVINVTSMPEISTPVTHQVIPKYIDEATYRDWFSVDTIQIKTFNTSNEATDAKISIIIFFDEFVTS